MTTYDGEVRHVLYRFFGEADVLLYVGISINPGARWQAHSHRQPWWPEVVRVTVTQFPDRPSVLAAERTAIETEKPRHNILHNGSSARIRVETPKTPAQVVSLQALRHKSARFKKTALVRIDTRAEATAAVVAALKAGIGPTEVVELSPFTAAHVRKIARAHGIPPAPPGIKLRKKASK